MTEDDSNVEGSVATAFAGVWDALTDVLGTAATATLMRRAIRESRSQSPVLDALTIVRDQFEYRYVVPPSWNTDSAKAMDDLRLLARQLTPLLSELTGPVVLRRLRTLDSELFPSAETEVEP